MNALDHYNAGNEFFVAEDYEGAAVEYDAAVRLDPSVASYFVARASNNLKRKEFLDVISDCNAALSLDAKNSAAALKLGMGYFFMDEFESANEAFTKAQSLGAKSVDVWLRKCSAELRSSGQKNEITNEIPPQREVSKKEAPNPEAPLASAVPLPPASSTAPLHEAQSVQSKASKTKFDFFQTSKNLSITIYAKGTNPATNSIVCTSNSVTVSIKFDDGSSFDRHWNLFAAVVDSKTEVKQSAYKVEIQMTKKEEQDWKGLEGARADSQVGGIVRPNITASSSAPSPYASKKDWNSVEVEVKKQDEQEKPEGQDALHKLFQQIYSNGNEETRRAMMKSYQTSGGTVLSTNWNEVAKKDYESEIEPPKGQEVKKWS